MKLFFIILSLNVAVLLSGCNGDAFQGDGAEPIDPGVPDKGSDVNVISKLDIIGSGSALDGVTPIDANKNDGVFMIDWTVTSSNPYDFELSSGEGFTYSDAGTFYAGTGECKGGNCLASKTLLCNLLIDGGTGKYSLKCESGESLNISDLVPLISTLKYIVLRICNRNSIPHECVTKPVPVSLGEKQG